MRVEVRPVTPADRDWVLAVKRVGLSTFKVVGDECRLVTLHVMIPHRGVGTSLADQGPWEGGG